MLKSLGLDDVTESVYRVMLTHHQDGVLRIAERLGISPDQVRDALDRLSELALLRPSHDSPGRLRAIGPELGMEILLARQQAELAAQQQRVEESKVAAARLISEFAELRAAAESSEVEQLVGLDEIRDRLGRLTREVRYEVMALAPDGTQTTENMEAAKPLDAELLGRGVRMRTLYLDSVRNNPPSVAYASWLGEQGGEVRTVPSLPVRMIVVDRRTAVLPTDGEDSGAGAVVLTGHGTLTALCALFDTLWDAGTPLGTGRRCDERGLSPQESEALRLLSQGLTDEAIAKRLGVSARTARRIAAELMDTLGARSRFQAGVRAAQRGWI